MPHIQVCRAMVGAVALLLVAANAARALDMAPAVIRYAGFAGVPLPTIIVAQERGFFKEQNLMLDIAYVQSAAEASQAIAAGQADLAHGTATSAMLAALKGAKLVLIGGIEASFTDKSGHSWEAVYLISRGDEGIRSIADLKGKRIGVPGVGSLYDYLLKARMLDLGWDPAKEVTFIPVPYPQAAGALIQKQVDAVIASMDGVTLAKSRGKVDVIGTHTSMEGAPVGYTAAVVASNEFLRNKPDVAIRFLRALLQARMWMAKALESKDPAYAEMLQKAFRFTPDKVQFYLETRAGYYGKDAELINPLDLPRELIEKNIKVLKQVGVLDAKVEASYDRLVDISLLRRAYESLNLTWDETKH